MHSIDIDGTGKVTLWTISSLGRSPCVRIPLVAATYDRLLEMFRTHVPLSCRIEDDIRETPGLYEAVVSAWFEYRKPSEG